jgi:hypothetical protein
MRQAKENAKLILGWGNAGVQSMCDYSLHSVKSRPAKVGDRLMTRDFGTQTRGFSAPEDKNVAVCVLPPAPSCPLQTKLGVYVCGRGLRTSSTTRPRSFDRSIKKPGQPITTRWNFQTAKSFF